MASTSAISGLVSGLDTKTLISQLMSLAKAPQTALKTELSTTNSQTTAAQAINTKAASMTTLAKELAAAKTYTTASASSSDNSVSVTSDLTATAGSIKFQVTQLAAAQSVLTDVIPNGALSSDATKGQTVTIGSKDYTADASSTTSAADIASAINADTTATVSATVVNDSTGSRLVLAAKQTGTANTFTAQVNGSTTGIITTAAAADAKIVIGGTTDSSGVTTGGTTITSSSNTFKSLMTGVDVTVSAKTTTPVTVSTAVNASGLSSKLSGLVTAMNNVLDDIAFHTKALATGTTASATNGGLLRGNSTMRDLASQVLNSVSSSSVGSLSTSATLAGLSVTKDGDVTFDATKFAAYYASNPTGAAATLQKFAGAVQTAGAQASDPATGAITSFITGNQSEVRTLTTNIAAWDDRLALKQTRLEAQYNALETALSKLKSQSDSLTSSLNALSNNSSN